MRWWTARCLRAESQFQKLSQSYATCRFPFGCIWTNIFIALRRLGYGDSEVVLGNTVCSGEIAADYRKLPGQSRVVSIGWSHCPENVACAGRPVCDQAVRA